MTRLSAADGAAPKRRWLVREVVRDVVAQVAPEELPVVDGLAALGDARAVRRLRRAGVPREQLGFGLGELVALVTPVVWLVLDETGRRFAAAVADGATTIWKRLLRKVFRRPAAAVTIPPLTREQLGEVHRRVLEVAARRGLPDTRAQAIADAVVARLALPAPGETAPAQEANRPATGENRAATGENRAATGENQAATGENRAATGKNRAATGEGRAATGKNRAATGEGRAATGDSGEDPGAPGRPS